MSYTPLRERGIPETKQLKSSPAATYVRTATAWRSYLTNIHGQGSPENIHWPPQGQARNPQETQLVSQELSLTA